MENTAQSSLAQGNAARVGSPAPEHMQPSQDLVEYLKAYARAKPDVAALWCFGIGFVIGWKLKPW